MKRHPLSCRALKAAGYDPNSSVLELEHSNGRVEQYLGVPPKTSARLSDESRSGEILS